MKILTVGIDLAKNVFAVHGVNEAGKPELVRPSVPRDQLAALIGMSAPAARKTHLRSDHFERQAGRIDHRNRFLEAAVETS